MHSKLCYPLAAGLLAVALSPVSAQSVTTTPVGAVSVTALANSDTLLSPTLVRPSVYEGTVSAVSGNELTLRDFSFDANVLQYSQGVQSNTYYLQVVSGSSAGHFSTVISNSTTSATLEFESDIIAGLAEGDRVVIRPYWTLRTLFPAENAGVSFVASTSTFNSGRRTELLFPNLTSLGINKSAAATYFYFQYWRKQGDLSPDRGDVIIPPGSFFTVRGNNSSTNTTLALVGVVDVNKLATPLLATVGQKNDNPVTQPRPIGIALGSLGLESAFVPSTSTFNSGRGDELLVFSSESAVKNRSASATYFYFGYWRKVGDLSPDQATTIIPAGSALVIRKKALTESAVIDWVLPELPL